MTSQRTQPVNDEPPVNPKNWLHYVLIGLDRLSLLPGPALAAIICASAVATGLAWYAATNAIEPAIAAGAISALCAFVDWAWLASLPRRGISHGPVEPPLLGLIVLRTGLSLFPLPGIWLGLSVWAGVTIGGMLQLVTLAIMGYATGIEPFRLGVTYLEIETHKLPPGTRLRLVQLSDLHIERITSRERDLIAHVADLQPDYILLTGDYLSFSFVGEQDAVAATRQVLGSLHARSGIYAVRGTHQVDPNAVMDLLLDDLPIRWLRSEHETVGQEGARVTFAGASCTRYTDIDVPAVQKALDGAPSDAYTVLLYHTPDLVEQAAAGGVDLYLAGHTHGGQIRLPLYGALYTATAVGKQYEMGRYDVEGLTLYVSRGIGMEGKGAPRARLLCPPEIVCIDLIGADRSP
jgi:hypothetical protein